MPIERSHLCFFSHETMNKVAVIMNTVIFLIKLFFYFLGLVVGLIYLMDYYHNCKTAFARIFVAY